MTNQSNLDPASRSSASPLSYLKGFLIVLLVGIVGSGCWYLALPYVTEDLGTSLPEYPGAVGRLVSVEEEYPPIGNKLITYETDDSPEEVYEFYADVFRWRWTWVRGDYVGGLLYRHRGCPASHYIIIATREPGMRTQVEIQLSQMVCI